MVRPRRSVLYMPGSNTRALEKGKSLPADSLILDLEDAVAPAEKVAARSNVVQAVREGGYGKRELLVRVNGLDTRWGYEDLVAVATSGAHGVVIPKVDSERVVMQAARVLVDAGASLGPADGQVGLWCMMETALGIMNAKEIALAASPLGGGLILGTSDLAKELRCDGRGERTPLLASLSWCVLAARAFGLPAVDGVHLDLQDEAGLRKSCEQGLALGFDGKTLIHPKTIAVANEVFAPSADKLTWARKVIDAFEEALAQGKGVVVVDGQLIENLHVKDAERWLALAAAIKQLEG